MLDLKVFLWLMNKVATLLFGILSIFLITALIIWMILCYIITSKFVRITPVTRTYIDRYTGEVYNRTYTSYFQYLWFMCVWAFLVMLPPGLFIGICENIFNLFKF